MTSHAVFCLRLPQLKPGGRLYEASHHLLGAGGPPTLSHRSHPSPAESFAALGEHPRDPLSILPFSLSRLVHRSALAAVLRQAARLAMVPSGFPCRAAIGRTGADLHHPSMDQQPRL
jgi:hypothetical protein